MTLSHRVVRLGRLARDPVAAEDRTEKPAA